MHNIHYLETGSRDPAYNLAFEEYLLKNHREEDILLLWQNEPTVVVGAHQNTEEEIDRSYVEEHGIHVVRRSTGGGAVYHDLGNLNYSFITDVGDAENLSLKAFMDPVIHALSALGVKAKATGKNDLVVEGYKVSGTAQRIDGDRILHHGTLLFDSDLDAVQAALKPKPEKYLSKGKKSVRSRVGNLREMLPKDMDLDRFWRLLLDELTRNGTTVPEWLCDAERVAIEELAEEKYRSYEWNYGRSPAFSLKGARRTGGGSIEVYAEVKQGLLVDVQFFGDYMARRPTEDVELALKGTSFRREDVSEVLDRFPLEDYFGSVTREEVLNVLFE